MGQILIFLAYLVRFDIKKCLHIQDASELV